MSAALEVVGLTKSYALGANRVEVLRGLDLAVARGELCAVMGPSGVGKSTLLNCVAGLDAPDGGTIAIDGHPVTGLDDRARTLLRRRRIGIVYQFFNLVSNLTALENVALPFLIDGEEPDPNVVRAALAHVGMSQRAQHLPAQLSGGEMQLVSIARAIVRRPPLVLADEPTGNVNVATGKRIMALLREVVKESDSALLLVTHNPEDAARADRIVFMKEGVLADGAALNGPALSAASVHERLQTLGI